MTRFLTKAKRSNTLSKFSSWSSLPICFDLEPWYEGPVACVQVIGDTRPVKLRQSKQNHLGREDKFFVGGRRAPYQIALSVCSSDATRSSIRGQTISTGNRGGDTALGGGNKVMVASFACAYFVSCTNARLAAWVGMDLNDFPARSCCWSSTLFPRSRS